MRHLKQVQHTPGPWTLQERDPGEFSVVDTNGVDLAVVMNWGDGISDGEVKKNAVIVSAAPDLLAALQDLAAQMQDAIHTNEETPDEGLNPSQGDKDALKAAKAAILKAEGRKS